MSTAHILVILLLIAGVAACLVFAYLSNRRNTRDLDKMGRDLGCLRWPEETNNSYHRRLRARIGLP